MGVNLGALARPVGPLPLWGWGALAGGGALLFMAVRGNRAAAALVNPAVAVPAPPAAVDAIAGGLLPSVPIPAGNTVYDPNTATSTPPVTIADILGGQSLGDFIGKLGPDYQSFQIQDGQLGASVQHSAQNVLDSANYQADTVYKIDQLNAQTDLQAIAGANQYGGDYTGASGTHYRNALGDTVRAAIDRFGGTYISGDTSFTAPTPVGPPAGYVAGAWNPLQNPFPLPTPRPSGVDVQGNPAAMPQTRNPFRWMFGGPVTQPGALPSSR